MDFFLTRGQDFEEFFDSKTPDGKLKALPPGVYKIILQRGSWAREYVQGGGLNKSRTRILWRIPASETKNFEYTTMYYTLYQNDNELARGVVKVQ